MLGVVRPSAGVGNALCGVGRCARQAHSGACAPPAPAVALDGAARVVLALLRLGIRVDLRTAAARTGARTPSPRATLLLAALARVRDASDTADTLLLPTPSLLHTQDPHIARRPALLQLLLLAHTLRRLGESVWFASLRSSSRMSVPAYAFGLSYYLMAPLTLALVDQHACRASSSSPPWLAMLMRTTGTAVFLFGSYHQHMYHRSA